MKRKIILFSLLILHGTQMKAQYGYAGISIGYGTGWPVYSLSTSTKITSTSTTYTLEKGNFGQGLNFAFSTGYMFNKNVGAELGISYLIGSKKEFFVSGLATDTNSGATTSTDGTITLDKIHMVRLNPALKLTMGDAVRPYLRMGINVGIKTGYTRIEEMVITRTGSMNDTTTTSEVAREFKGGMAFGFSSAFGVDIDLTDNLIFFGELSFNSISWAATKSVVTRSLYNGVDMIPSSDPASLETEYVDDYTVSQNHSNSNKELKTYLPFGSFGISAGVIYRFGNE